MRSKGTASFGIDSGLLLGQEVLPTRPVSSHLMRKIILRRRRGPVCRTIVQYHVQQRIMYPQFSVVIDEPQLTKLIHEKTHPRPSGSDHHGKSLLADFWYHRLWSS